MSRLCQSIRNVIPTPPPDPVEWCERWVKFPKSARSKDFNVSVTPWIREPLSRIADGVTRVLDLVKPVQSGGSSFGEAALLYLFTWLHGMCFYNWPNNKKAEDRWKSRFAEILEACDPVSQKLQRLAKFDAVKGQVDFGNVFFRMQGVFEPGNLDSDTVRFQVNEELHEWEPGHLAKSVNRATAVWNYLILNISNAGKKGDQLHQSFEAGTQQHWEVKCPGCRQFHRMRTRWDERRPDLGGLRYDADGCRLDSGRYNYNKLVPTIRFQMPCGYIVHDNPLERRALSLSGRYSEPTNPGAPLSHRSYTYEAVAVDYISWLELIQQKHEALFARRRGDPEPWRRYITERECLFYDPDDVPIVGKIVLNTGRTKNRDGLRDRQVYGVWFDKAGRQLIRLFALDRQQGEASKQEFPHWWLVIRDVVVETADSMLVYEGKVETDENVISILDDHECERRHGVADSGDDTVHVYLFCLKHGIHAIKGGGEVFYTHEGGARRIFSEERPLHAMINRDPLYPYTQLPDLTEVPDVREPMFWIYSKAGIRERLAWLRSSTKWEVPADVSEDYQQHMEAEERVSRQQPRTGEIIYEWRQLKSRNDLFVCEAYVSMQVEMAGLVGAMPEEEPK